MGKEQIWRCQFGGHFLKKVFADESLNYSQDVEFTKPANFNINLDCNDSNKSHEEIETIEDFF